jgi:lipopolysaccharide transport system ATP-binding protein
MSNIAIRIENLSKCYQLGTIGTGTFYGDLKRWWAKIIKKPDPYAKVDLPNHFNRDGQTVWALRDINLDIQQGDVLGIIGHNGAGKSTLLKILSRITSPTTGEAKIKGRLVSLLEVGTGFHNELTGRENIFLNGSIMGMNRKEVVRKFDEIVNFSEVEKYIDTPVKRYSSGMYMRLAFSVAAFLDPDVLVVDEVLAVGDASFQKKSIGKMGEVASEGRTVLFVSHNMGAIATLTRNCIWLDRGKVREFGSTEDVIHKYTKQYLSPQEKTGTFDLEKHPRERILPREVEFIQATISSSDRELRMDFQEGAPIYLDVDFRANKHVTWLQLTLRILTVEGVPIFSILLPKEEVDLAEGIYASRISLSPNYLRPGRYVATLNVHTSVLQDQINDALIFEVRHRLNGEEHTFWTSDQRGLVRFDQYAWSKVARKA